MVTPAEVLSAWPALRGFTVRDSLSSSVLCDKWRLQRGSEQLVLRIDRPLAAAVGLDREVELTVLQHLIAEGFQAGPVLHEPGVLVVPFLPGEVWGAEAFASSVNLGELARLLRRLHRLSLPAAPADFDLAAKLKRYAERINTSEAFERLAEAQALLSRLEPGQTMAICHNDPLAGNVVADPRGIMLIDWEFAGVGYPAFDLAAVAVGQGLSEDLSAALLKAYGPDSAALQEDFAGWRQVYSLTCELWFEAVRPA